MRIRSNQIGEFNVNSRIVYYFDDEKDKAEDYTLNLPIKVRKEITSASAQEPITNPTPKPISGFGTITGISGLLLIIFSKKIWR